MNTQNIRNMLIGLIVVSLLGWGFYNLTRDKENFPGEMLFREGNYRLEHQEYKRALECFKQVQKINPSFLPGYLGEALVYIQQGKNKQAREILNSLIEKDSSFAEAWANRGILNDKEGRYKEAIRDYQKALELNPSLGKGPGFLYRLLHNISQPPSTIADRLEYLLKEMKKPPEKRILKIPELDSQQPINTQRRFL